MCRAIRRALNQQLETGRREFASAEAVAWPGRMLCDAGRLSGASSPQRCESAEASEVAEDRCQASTMVLMVCCWSSRLELLELAVGGRAAGAN